MRICSIVFFCFAITVFYDFSRYFTLLAMSLGCRVLAFEPQTRLLPVIKRSLYFNNFDSRLLALIPCALSHDQRDLTYKDHHNWGEWSLSRASLNGNKSSTDDISKHSDVNSVCATTLDSLLQDDVLVCRQTLFDY
jgi:hypothetical protein